MRLGNRPAPDRGDLARWLDREHANQAAANLFCLKTTHQESGDGLPLEAPRAVSYFLILIENCDLGHVGGH